MAETAHLEDNEYTRWVTFRLEGKTYGINVMQVQEVLRVTEIAPVPGTPDYVMGIINLRGNVVSVLDTRKRLGLLPKEADDSTRIIIVESDSQIIGIMVDSVTEVVDVQQAMIELAPNIGDEKNSRYIEGVVSMDASLLILVNQDRLMTDEEWAELSLL